MTIKHVKIIRGTCQCCRLALARAPVASVGLVYVEIFFLYTGIGKAFFKILIHECVTKEVFVIYFINYNSFSFSLTNVTRKQMNSF